MGVGIQDVLDQYLFPIVKSLSAHLADIDIPVNAYRLLGNGIAARHENQSAPLDDRAAGEGDIGRRRE
jgi:hypothetical protein